MRVRGAVGVACKGGKGEYGSKGGGGSGEGEG